MIFDNMISCNHLLLIILAGGCLGSDFYAYNPNFHWQFFLPLSMEAKLELSFSSLSVMQIWMIMMGLVPVHLLGAAKPTDPISMNRPPVIVQIGSRTNVRAQSISKGSPKRLSFVCFHWCGRRPAQKCTQLWFSRSANCQRLRFTGLEACRKSNLSHKVLPYRCTIFQKW
jgi:hypothetical protein